jgi:membrane-bound serine protease (ClpP class)
VKRPIRHILVILIAALAIAALTAIAAPPHASAQGAREVVVLEATGPVVPPFGSYIRHGIEDADARNAEAVIIVLDTPGGLVNVTGDIIQDIRTADVPVIVFVGPRGAQSASAGLLITLAGHAAAMAPDTAIGASSPIGAQGEDLPSTSQQKAEQYLSAQARSLAERRGPAAVEIAGEAVTEARAVSASEALDAGLVDFVVEDVDELLGALDGFQVEVNGRPRTLHTADATTIPLPMSQLERALIILTDPNLVFILLSIGVTALIVEIRSPGGWAAGMVGVTSLGLALYGLGVLPVNWLGIAFILMAFVLFILDIKAPLHGALSAAAVVSLAAGAIILFNQPEIAPFGRLSIPLVIVWSLIIGAIFVFLVAMALRAQARRPTTGYEGMIGQHGRVTQALDPVGMVQVFGERWQAEAADRHFIDAGQAVEVIATGRMRLVVRELPDDR